MKCSSALPLQRVSRSWVVIVLMSQLQFDFKLFLCTRNSMCDSTIEATKTKSILDPNQRSLVSLVGHESVPLWTVPSTFAANLFQPFHKPCPQLFCRTRKTQVKKVCDFLFFFRKFDPWVCLIQPSSSTTFPFLCRLTSGRWLGRGKSGADEVRLLPMFSFFYLFVV